MKKTHLEPKRHVWRRLGSRLGPLLLLLLPRRGRDGG
jgi:hypothetical protein